MARGAEKGRKQRPRRTRDPDQSKRFIEAAIAAGLDETGEKFARALEKVARRIPPKSDSDTK
jgi:hypothetical protein